MDTIREVGRQMMLLYPRLMRGVQGSSISHLRLTATQTIILVTLRDLKKCTVTTLAKVKGVSLSTITGIVDRLVQARFVRRERDKRDRRIVLLGLSAKGEKIVDDLLGIVEKRWQAIASELSEPERQAFIKLLRKIARVLSSGPRS